MSGLGRGGNFSARKLNSSGSILILTLWTLITLSILAIALGSFVSGQIKFSKMFIRANSALPAAQAAIYDALGDRSNDQTPEFDSEQEMLEERGQRLSGNNGYKYYFEDEMAKININTASSEVLNRLPGIDSKTLAGAIVNSSRRPFKVKEEILLVEGMDRDKFELCKDFITTYGDGKVNINTASAAALSALGLDDELVETILRYRKESFGPDEEEHTNDDGAFLSNSNVLGELRGFRSLSLAEELQLLSLTGFITVKSKAAAVRITADLGGKTGNKYTAVLDIEENKVVFWSE